MSLHNMDMLREALGRAEPLPLQGRVLRAAGITVEATLPRVAVGSSCEIRASGGRIVVAEVVGFSGPTAILMPFGDMQGVCEGCPVIPRTHAADVPVGDALLGRVVDANIRPMDGGPLFMLRGKANVNRNPPQAMSRKRISKPLALGVKLIDTCLTIGEGQRVGIMAGPGVGKSVLLGMVAKHANVDVIVVGLIGERGREVREFVERDLGPQGLARSVVVVATADEPPLVRVRAALAATAIAEYFRDQGKRVMLLVDSLSRVAMAQREIGLSAGEPPATKGYPPSVFAHMPRLLERAGLDEGPGSITGLYTVLAEGDDLSDPVVDAARAALDGHIILSRKLASAGQFPAVDLLGSISRVMTDIATPDHLSLAMNARDVLSAYRESADLIDVGAYVSGSNPRVDRAIRTVPGLNKFFKQSPNERFELSDSLAQLKAALRPALEGRNA
jgi:flagellum-specific ATP synthase